MAIACYGLLKKISMYPNHFPLFLELPASLAPFLLPPLDPLCEPAAFLLPRLWSLSFGFLAYFCSRESKKPPSWASRDCCLARMRAFKLSSPPPADASACHWVIDAVSIADDEYNSICGSGRPSRLR